ncbi:MAG: NUDIX domain-containing protein [Anaerolineae bacterium]
MIVVHYVVRGILFVDGQVLLAHQLGADNTFLPGRYIEPGERATTALVRELEEELGAKPTVKRFVGAVEYRWADDAQDNHELNLLFEVAVPGLSPDAAPCSLEPHLEFIWSTPEDLVDRNLQPAPLIDSLRHWTEGYSGYWGTWSPLDPQTTEDGR